MIYLDNAATTYPKPKTVYKNIMDCMTNYCANPGRSSHTMAIEGAKVIYETRELVAKLFNFDDPLRVIFTSNATDSLNLAIKGYLKTGDHVITTSMEHNSVLRPIHHLEAIGVEHTIINCNDEGLINLNDLQKSIKANTKLIVTTHVSNLTGTIFPIKEIGAICRKNNICYLVDASQSAGVLDIDMKECNIDMLAAPGHKGLLGPQGVGILLLGNGIELQELKEGGTGSESSKLTQPIFCPDKYESGTPNLPGIAGLNAGIKYIMSKGVNSIYNHEKKLLDLFINEASKNDKIQIYGPKSEKDRCSVVCLNIIDKDSSEVAYNLDSIYGIAVRPGLHCAPLAHKTIGTKKIGAVRFSFGPFNKKEEIMYAIKALNEISNK
ncbi:aminotransferase class V-fold PLP-dependent enzyme [Sedimentibacter sp. zth1]|uniref:aminotransferase class V-fold PLP-dependent enzyme n=1 Tax=Sedimentibacter sp. zth1 TaxID=2816908 RepID=UPI001A92FF25|nr:aminotransferase class V-fold PLP-dependent enzyme [Sedimentibacter sp. zth1]QSX05195.1 aminotransferase class V-fold PLP-dependent enzyme [Sedimentibacter sp. zth1]